MGLSRASGSLLSQTAIGNFSVTGIDFHPRGRPLAGKVLLLWGGRHESALGPSVHSVLCVGVATSATAQGCIGFESHDNLASSNSGSTHQHGSVYREVEATPTTTLDLAFVSFDADGFTLNQVVADATARRIFYLVLGGTDITNAKVGTVNIVGATGTQAFTGVGFQPDLLLLLTARINGTTANQAPDVNLSVGVGRSATERWALGLGALDSSAAGESRGTFDATKIVAQPRTDTNAYQNALDLVSMDADGFTVDRVVNQGNLASVVIYLALQGTYRAKAGVFNQKTSPGPLATTGIGFRPVALLLASGGKPTATAVSDNGTLSLGVAFWPANQRVAASTGDQAADPTAEDKSASEAVGLRHLVLGSGAVLAEAALARCGSDGFTLDWTTADATAREHGYWALAPAVDEGSVFLPRTGTGHTFDLDQPSGHHFDLGWPS